MRRRLLNLSDRLLSSEFEDDFTTL